MRDHAATKDAPKWEDVRFVLSVPPGAPSSGPSPDDPSD